MWVIEEIPDVDELFYRIHNNYFVNNEIVPGAFVERGEGENRGMSTDWGKYAKPADTRKRGLQKSKMYGVISFIAGKLREDCELIILHAPTKKNRAHSHFRGLDVDRPKREEIRVKMLDLYKWEIKLT